MVRETGPRTLKYRAIPALLHYNSLGSRTRYSQIDSPTDRKQPLCRPLLPPLFTAYRLLALGKTLVFGNPNGNLNRATRCAAACAFVRPRFARSGSDRAAVLQPSSLRYCVILRRRLDISLVYLCWEEGAGQGQGTTEGKKGRRERYCLFSSLRSSRRSCVSRSKLSIVRARAQMWVRRLSVCHLFRVLQSVVSASCSRAGPRCVGARSRKEEGGEGCTLHLRISLSRLPSCLHLRCPSPFAIVLSAALS